MNPLRLLALLLGLAVAGPALSAQRPPLPAASPGDATATPAAEEVYTPEPVGTGPAKTAAATSSSSVAPAPAPAGATAKDKKSNVPSAPTAAGAPPPLSPRFQQIRDRIEVLFGHRNTPPPPADPRRNPFRAPGAAPVAAAPAGVPAENAPPPTAAAVDLALLKQTAATLKVAGTIEIGGRAHLIINQVPYKEGDMINARAKGQPVFLRVKHISRYSYTLSLNTAELSVKY